MVPDVQVPGEYAYWHLAAVHDVVTSASDALAEGTKANCASPALSYALQNSRASLFVNPSPQMGRIGPHVPFSSSLALNMPGLR